MCQVTTVLSVGIRSVPQPVLAHHGVEDWLGRVESAMRASLKRLILKHVRQDSLDFDSSQLPLQVSTTRQQGELFFIIFFLQWKKSLSFFF